MFNIAKNINDKSVNNPS